MAIDFPNSPITNQEYTVGSSTWVYDGSKWNIKTAVAYSNDSAPVGTIVTFAGSTAPAGWIKADGSSLSTSTYAQLFSVIGYTFGGSGASFTLPNIVGTTGIYIIRYSSTLGTVATDSLYTAPVGAMLQWATTGSYPTGWLRADGSAISRTSYADLFSLIGTTYGTGDGSTTFNMPNMVADSSSPVYIIKATLSGGQQPSAIAHAANHIRTGSDVIDGDRLQVDYVPTSYTANQYATGAGATTDLTAHLSGIDNFFIQPSNRNVIINGNMNVAQRSTSVTVSTGAYNTADRWKTTANYGTYTQSVVTDAPTGSGFNKALKMACTASVSPATNNALSIYQIMEGQNVQHFAKGSSGAKAFAVSFWVKSNVTGTYVVALYDGTNTRSVGKTYTINAVDTWEKKTIIFPADTSGAFNNDANASLYLEYCLGAGTGWTSGTLNTSWASYVQANYFAGQTANIGNSNSYYWQITGVQLEPTQVTPFEFEPFETTLRKCMRYYQVTDYFQGTANSTTTMAVVAPALVPMRATITPSIRGTTWAASDNYAADANASSPTMPNFYDCSPTGARVVLGGFSGLTTGRYYNSRPSTTSLIALSAEL